MEVRKCEWCGNTVKDGPPNKKYCSKECKYEAQKKRQRKDKTIICGWCGKEFMPVHLGRPKYCSYECVVNARQNQLSKRYKKSENANSGNTCLICGKPYEAGSNAAKYCPDCRISAAKEQKKAWQNAKITNQETVSKKTVKPCKHEDCMYRGRISGGIIVCDYCFITDMPRGCPVENCDKYQIIDNQEDKIRTAYAIRKIENRPHTT